MLNVTDFNAIKAAVDKIEYEIGSVDSLVNNAGYGYEGSLIQFNNPGDFDSWQAPSLL